MKYGSSSYLRPTQDNVRKYVGILNCFALAKTSFKNCFQYLGVSLTELIKENSLLLAISLFIVPLYFCLIVTAVS